MSLPKRVARTVCNPSNFFASWLILLVESQLSTRVHRVKGAAAHLAKLHRFQPGDKTARVPLHQSHAGRQRPFMLIINNELVSQLLTMDDCIRVQEEAFRNLPAGGSIHRPRIDMYVPAAQEDGYFRWGTMEGAN